MPLDIHFLELVVLSLYFLLVLQENLLVLQAMELILLPLGKFLELLNILHDANFFSRFSKTGFYLTGSSCTACASGMSSPDINTASSCLITCGTGELTCAVLSDGTTDTALTW